MSNTQYTIADVHRITGKSRTTIGKHLKSGKLSYTTDNSGHKRIEASELIRAYGSDACDFDRADAGHKSKLDVQGRGGRTLHSELTSVQRQLNSEVKERERERRQFQEQTEHLQESLKLAQEGYNKAMLLLEHRTAGAGTWEQVERKLEERLANQESRFEKRVGDLKRDTRQEVFQELKSLSWWRAMFRLATS